MDDQLNCLCSNDIPATIFLGNRNDQLENGAYCSLKNWRAAYQAKANNQP